MDNEASSLGERPEQDAQVWSHHGRVVTEGIRAHESTQARSVWGERERGPRAEAWRIPTVERSKS